MPFSALLPIASPFAIPAAPAMQSIITPYENPWGYLGQLMSQAAPAMQQFIGQQSFGGSAPMAPDEYRPLFATAAEQYGIPQNLLEAMAYQESRFRPDARSPAGAQGIMQLMPATAQGLGVQNPLDPAQSIDGGARYFRQMLDMFGGDYRLALAAYNAGPGNVRRYGNAIPPFAETQNYVQSIMGRLGQ